MVKLHPDVGVVDVSGYIDCEGTDPSLGVANASGYISGKATPWC